MVPKTFVGVARPLSIVNGDYEFCFKQVTAVSRAAFLKTGFSAGYQKRFMDMRLSNVAMSLLAMVLPVVSLEAGEQAPEEQAGLPVGQVAPAFTLKDQNGKQVSLASLLKDGPVALVFVRSADWCLYCKLQLIQLQRNLEEIQSRGGQVVAVSYDSPDKLKYFANKCKIAFPLLSDTDSKIIEAYDIRNKAAPKEWGGVSRHGTFIIDQQAVIRAKLFQVSYKERPAVENLIKVLKQARATNSNEGDKQ